MMELHPSDPSTTCTICLIVLSVIHTQVSTRFAYPNGSLVYGKLQTVLHWSTKLIVKPGDIVSDPIVPCPMLMVPGHDSVKCYQGAEGQRNTDLVCAILMELASYNRNGRLLQTD